MSRSAKLSANDAQISLDDVDNPPESEELKVEKMFGDRPPMWKNRGENTKGGKRCCQWMADGFPFARSCFAPVPFFSPGSKDTEYPWGAETSAAARAFRDPNCIHNVTEIAYDKIEGLIRTITREEAEKRMHEPFDLSAKKKGATLLQDDMEEIGDAVKTANSQAFARAISNIGEAEAELAKEMPFDERVQVIAAELMGVMAKFKGDKEAAATFMLTALQPFMPDQLRDIGTQACQGYKDERLRRKHYARRKEEDFKQELGPFSNSILQAPSDSAQWEVDVGTFGKHPGVIFGMHCSGSVQANHHNAEWGRDRGYTHPIYLYYDEDPEPGMPPY